MEFFTLKDDSVTLKINPKMYNLETVYSAAYQILENNYVFFDGDPEKEILVNISFKENSKNTEKNLENAGKEFMNHLLNYNFERINSNNKEMLRALLLKQSFTSIKLENYDEEKCPTCGSEESNETDTESEENQLTEEEESVFDEDDDLDIDEEDFEFDDPDGIAIPWEEKYGKDGENNGN
jgi:His-Xaa-Ser system protein HxsD